MTNFDLKDFLKQKELKTVDLLKYLESSIDPQSNINPVLPFLMQQMMNIPSHACKDCLWCKNSNRTDPYCSKFKRELDSEDVKTKKCKKIAVLE